MTAKSPRASALIWRLKEISRRYGTARADRRWTRNGATPAAAQNLLKKSAIALLKEPAEHLAILMTRQCGLEIDRAWRF